MAGFTLQWNSQALLDKARRGAVRGLTEVDLRIEAEAKSELYPGHGLLTGALRRSIVGEEAQEAGPTTARGRVVTKGIRYAARLHRRYGYLRKGYEKVKPRIREIVTDAIRQELKP